MGGSVGGTDGIEVSHGAGARRQVPQNDVAIVAGAEEYVCINGIVFQHIHLV